MIQGVEVIAGTGYDRAATWSALQCFPSFISALHIQRVQVCLHRQAATFGIDEGFLQEATHWVVHSGYLELYVIEPSRGLYKSSRGEGHQYRRDVRDIFWEVQLKGEAWGVLSKEDKVFIVNQLYEVTYGG